MSTLGLHHSEDPLMKNLSIKIKPLKNSEEK